LSLAHEYDVDLEGEWGRGGSQAPAFAVCPLFLVRDS